MSIQNKISLIHELDDPEKVSVVLKVIMESENEDIIEKANELWVLLVLAHGDLLSQKFNEIATSKKLNDDLIMKMQQQMNQAHAEVKKYEDIKKDKIQWKQDLYNKDPNGWT